MDVWLAPRSYDHHRPSSIPAFWSRSNLPDRTQKFGVKILERSKREKDPIRKYLNGIIHPFWETAALNDFFLTIIEKNIL